jgi:putative ABC transport system substrate-binding protein
VITRRSISLAGGASLLLAHPLGLGQPGATMRRVGLLAISSQASTTHIIDAFKLGMRELGWVDAKNIEYRYGYANGDVDRMDALVGELIVQQVDVIVVGNPPGIRAAQMATKTIPIVMAYGANAVGLGFVASLARPGGNITGITSQQEDVLGKLIGTLHEAVPGARRIAILISEKSPSRDLFWSAAQSACSALQLVAVRVVASAPAQLGAAVEEIVRQRSQAVVVTTDAMYLAERTTLQELMQTSRLPVAYGFREQVIAGGLLSYAADLSASFRYAAKYVDRILKGAKPGDLPVEQPTKFELVINLKTAKALGLRVPQALLLRADEVIQ